jgi:hypothetical protein
VTTPSPEVPAVVVAELQPRWLPLAPAADYSGIGVKSLRRLISSGKLIPRRPVKGRIVLDRLELDAYIGGAVATPRTGRGRS